MKIPVFTLQLCHMFEIISKEKVKKMRLGLGNWLSGQESLLCKQEDQGLNPKYPWEEEEEKEEEEEEQPPQQPEIAMCVCNSSTREWEQLDVWSSLARQQPKMVSFRFSETLWHALVCEHCFAPGLTPKGAQAFWSSVLGPFHGLWPRIL